MIVDAMTAGRAHARLLTDGDVEDLYAAWSARPEDDVEREVHGLAIDLSENLFWAGWLQDLALSLWDTIHTEPKHWPEGRGTRAENYAAMQRLVDLTVGADEPWFFIEDLDGTVLGRYAGVVRKAPLAECEAHFAKMQARPAKPPYAITPPAR